MIINQRFVKSKVSPSFRMKRSGMRNLINKGIFLFAVACGLRISHYVRNDDVADENYRYYGKDDFTS